MAKPPVIITGHERIQTALRQWSGLVAEQVTGWGTFGGGIFSILDPHNAPAIMVNHPLAFTAAGLGVLSGRKAAELLKSMLGTIV